MVKNDIQGKGILIAIIVAIVFLVATPRQEIIGEKTFRFEKSMYTPFPLSIGDSSFSTTGVSFLCVDRLTQWNDANAGGNDRWESNECWAATLKYENKNYKFEEYGETIQLNNYLEATFKPNVKYEYDEDGDRGIDSEDERVIYHITLVNKEFLEATISDYTTIVLLSKQESIPVTIRNNLANNIPGGLVIKTTYSKIQNKIDIKDVPMTFKKGINTYSIELDSNTLGRQDILVQPYFTIQGQKLYDDRVATVTYNVISEVSDIQTMKCVTNVLCPKDYECAQLKIDGVHKQMCIPAGEEPSDDDFIGDSTSQFLEVNPSIWILVFILLLIGILIYKNRKR